LGADDVSSVRFQELREKKICFVWVWHLAAFKLVAQFGVLGNLQLKLLLRLIVQRFVFVTLSKGVFHLAIH
jgi:hypothetical protein